MAKAKRGEIIQGTEKEFLDVFNRLCYSRSPWQVWADLISAIACTLSNVTDRTQKHFEAREREYAQCIERLGSVETPAEILHVIVMALENEPEQDFLGKMYMNLNLENHWKGQFFTPYGICKMMSQMTVGDVDRQIEEQGYISIYDPACGAGATLIAVANTLKRSKYNFQNHALFVGQDVDRVVAQMCYIQLSLLGCAGYICVGNTITNPLTGPVLFPRENEGQEMWYMPMFQSGIWRWRKIFHSLGSLGGTVTTEKTVEKEHFYMFFDFEEKWQKVRDCMKEKREVRHFTAENTVENAYGWTWEQVVKEYLKNGYNAADNSPDIVVVGETYKTLKRPTVTVFYDAAGDTLFDVTNERLEKEYEWLMNSGTVDVAESMDAGEENGEDGKGNSVVEQTEEDPKAGEAPPTEQAEAEEEDITDNGADDDVIPMGTTSLKGIVTGLPAPTTEEIAAAKEENAKPAKQRAKEKLEKERESAKDSTFADPIIEYLLKRCNEDEGMAEDVVQEHKTCKKCFDYIYSRARKQAKGNCTAVRDDVVYEWAEDYYHKDDKAEEERKAKKAAEDKVQKTATEKAKKVKSATGRKTAKAKGNTEKTEKVSVPLKAEARKAPPKPKKSPKEMDGQMDLFSMMGV